MMESLNVMQVELKVTWNTNIIYTFRTTRKFPLSLLKIYSMFARSLLKSDRKAIHFKFSF